MKKTFASVLSFLFVLLLAVPANAQNLSTIGTLNSSSKSAVVSGLDLTTYNFTDKNNAKQLAYVMEFNPQKSNLSPYMYHKNNGNGSLVLDDAKYAESNLGLNVVGGVNADFFSMSENCYGIIDGMYISDGKIATDTVGSFSEQLVFDSAGKAAVATANLSYQIYVNGEEWFYKDEDSKSTALEFINKRSEKWSNRIYYFDSSCGTKTGSSLAGTEIVVKKKNGTDLVVGGTLKGEVVEIRKNSFNSNIAENQFVLYIKNGSSLGAKANSLSVGSKINITVNEDIETYKTVMENAITSIPVSIPIVKKGVNIVGTPEFDAKGVTNDPGQRTAVGIKADGSVVILACDGRKASAGGAAGLNFDQTAKMMLEMGCIDAFDLDGGGSTQMVAQKTDGTLGYVYSSTRPIANSLLIICRSAVPSTKKAALQDAVNKISAEFKNKTMPATVNSYLNKAKSVLAAQTSMNGDYTGALTRLLYAYDNKDIKINEEPVTASKAASRSANSTLSKTSSVLLSSNSEASLTSEANSESTQSELVNTSGISSVNKSKESRNHNVVIIVCIVIFIIAATAAVILLKKFKIIK